MRVWCKLLPTGAALAGTTTSSQNGRDVQQYFHSPDELLGSLTRVSRDGRKWLVPETSRRAHDQGSLRQSSLCMSAPALPTNLGHDLKRIHVYSATLWGDD